MPIVLKSGSVNLLEISGPVQVCNGIAFLHVRYRRTLCPRCIGSQYTEPEWAPLGFLLSTCENLRSHQNIQITLRFTCTGMERLKMHLINPLKPELNPICYLLALLGANHFLHVSRIRVKLLTFRRLMSYIYGAPILDVSRSHTTTQHSR